MVDPAIPALSAVSSGEEAGPAQVVVGCPQVGQRRELSAAPGALGSICSVPNEFDTLFIPFMQE